MQDSTQQLGQAAAGDTQSGLQMGADAIGIHPGRTSGPVAPLLLHGQERGVARGVVGPEPEFLESIIGRPARVFELEAPVGELVGEAVVILLLLVLGDELAARPEAPGLC